PLAAPHAPPTRRSSDLGSYPNGKSATTGCHDITAYPEKDIAAGACMGEGILMDIRDPEKPRVISTVRDETNFAFWHSATFNNKRSEEHTSELQSRENLV